jgi:hypothetical protein
MLTLNRAYGGYAAGTIVQLPKDTEDALIAQGLGVTSAAGPVTGGAATSSYFSGRAGVAIAATSVVITHASCNVSSQVFAVVAQAAADGTALRVERVVPAAGLFTIHVTAAATALTTVNWMLIP